MPTLLDLVLSVVMLSVVSVTMFTGVSVLVQKEGVITQHTEAMLVLNSVVENATQAAFSSTYPTSGSSIQNPDNYPVSLSVAYYEQGKSPAFSISYPSSGLEDVSVTVTQPNSVTVSASVYKSQ